MVLRGFPSFEDNLVAIYDALASRAIDEIVWIVDDPLTRPPTVLRAKTRFVKRGSIQDYYCSMTSRYLFITHGHFLRTTPPNQICVNLWHGIPFKAIGKTMGLEGRSDTFLVATSNIVRKVFGQAFGMPKKSIIVTGQARTDRMLNVDRGQVWQRAFPERQLPDKIFFWMPTYRSSSYAEGEADGSTFDNPFNCSDFSAETFNALLEEGGAVCLVKPHPMATRVELKNHSNILYIDEAWLIARGLSLYELTGATDCLISDVSSITADFMLLDRPIILLFEDIEAYGASRGFSFAPITDFLPARVAHDFGSFLIDLKAVLDDQDPYVLKRTELKKLFFDHVDGKASERILDVALGVGEAEKRHQDYA